MEKSAGTPIKRAPNERRDMNRRGPWREDSSQRSWARVRNMSAGKRNKKEMGGRSRDFDNSPKLWSRKLTRSEGFAG